MSHACGFLHDQTVGVFLFVFVFFFFPFKGIKEVFHHSNKHKMDGGFNLSLKQDFETTEKKEPALWRGTRQHIFGGPEKSSTWALAN